MASQFIDMDPEAFILINGPLIFLNLTANIFYAYCLSFPLRNGQRLKQPLKVLLGMIVWSSILYCVCLSMLYYEFDDSKSYVVVMTWLIVLSFVHNSMTCSVWLNFFYYTQIVPSQKTFLIWIKKNIRSVIYGVLLFGGTLLLFNTAGSVADMIFSPSTQWINGTSSEYQNLELDLAGLISFSMVKVYVLICMCIMMVSSFSTVQYLQGGSSFSTPKIKSQKRVAFTGVSQGVLYFLFDTYNLLESFTNAFSSHYTLGAWISFTVTSLYITGSTVNLGIGQAVFRLRVVNIWRTIKTLSTVGRVTNDVKAHPVHSR